MPNVLLIDNSRTVLAAVRLALAQGGYEVATLSDYEHLDETLARGRPDVVVLDLLMPGATGMAFANEIRSHFDVPPPIILYSGSDTTLMQSAAREMRAAAVVAKDEGIERLLDLVALLARGSVVNGAPPA